ncbi:Crp/Fnr family transcriptional regulator [Runella sp. SP2]|uniref:Crp/Fnr family transcriptional regulator n=1 Tax=Runella sp. SP2 TaxID=2268026 RepID=UPI000F085E3A|nr:Crp/Fnr family transcriptional regulator [Runella sp. SP2]AYQ32596.1 Crp/Fnr family transcriptional regulator [Runella sp. SP2]
MDILSYLKQHGIYSDSLVDWVQNHSKTKTYPKGQVLFAEGDSPQRVYFIESGLLRMFYEKDGKEITHGFFAEDSVLMSVESIFYQQHSPYGCDALEPTTVTSFNFRDFTELSNKLPEVSHLEKLILYGVIKKLADTNYFLKFHTAKERYERMIAEYPNILLRAPLGHVASYLGITQQTLSVIRGQIA